MIATYEKPLTLPEIAGRKLERDTLWSEWRLRQGEQSKIAADLRALQRVMREGLGRINQLQVEIDSGVAQVPRQQELPGDGMVDPVTFGIDGMSDEPDPGAAGEGGEFTTYAEYETGHYAGFARAYPAPTTHERLTALLSTVFAPSQWGTADLVARVKKWDPSSAVFQDVAHWARVEKARADSMARAQRGEPGEGGITIPKRPPMPLKLEQALGLVPKRAKAKGRSARKPARKAKARK